MTKDELQTLRGLVDAATPGPWRAISGKGSATVQANECAVYINVSREGVMHPDTIARWQADARFIAAARTALPALIDRVEELERERDEARNRVLRPLTEREVQAALHEGRAEAMAATGDNAWTSLLTARDKLAAECERLRALVNRAADSLDYCVQRHGEHSKSVRGDELRLAAIASEGGGEVSDEKTLDNKQLDMLRMIADTHHRTECASWKLLWLIDQHRALSTALATAIAERDAARAEVERACCRGEPHTCDQERVAAAEGRTDRLIIELAEVRAYHALRAALDGYASRAALTKLRNDIDRHLAEMKR